MQSDPGIVPAVERHTGPAQEPPVVGYIGDSISEQNFVVPATTAFLTANASPAGSISAINRGASGRTTRSWLPSGVGSEAGLLSNAEAAFNAAGVTIVSIMLGTNDSKITENIDKASYKANLVTIIDHLFANVPTLRKVVLQYAASPTTTYSGNGDFANSPISGYTRVLQYHAAVEEILATSGYSGRVYGSSRSGYDLYAANPPLLPDGIHPVAGESASVLAHAWAQGISSALAETDL